MPLIPLRPELAEKRMSAFGCAGWADKIPFTTLQEQADAYRNEKYGNSAKPSKEFLTLARS